MIYISSIESPFSIVKVAPALMVIEHSPLPSSIVTDPFSFIFLDAKLAWTVIVVSFDTVTVTFVADSILR